MNSKFRSVAIVVASAGYAQAALSSDEKASPLLIASIPGSAWAGPSMIAAPQVPGQAAPSLASFLPALPSSFFGTSTGTSRLLFLSPLSPLRAALRVAAQDLADQTRAAFQPTVGAASGPDEKAEDGDSSSSEVSAAARRREVVLRQRRKSVLNDREAGSERARLTEALESDLDLSGFSGKVELLTLPGSSSSVGQIQSSIPNGAGIVSVSGYLTDDLSFALTGLAAESAATTWRGGAEFELAAGDRNHIEVGAVYGTRFSATNAPIGGEVDRRSVGAFRLVHALRLSDTVSTRAGGRFVEAPFLHSSRSVDPEFSILIEQPEGEGTSAGRTYLQMNLDGDTLFPGLEVVTGGNDLIALAEGLPVFARDFHAQRTWTGGLAVGYHEAGTRMEARIQDQRVSHALLVLPSSISGAPLVENGSRNRATIGSVKLEKTFGNGQAQTGVEYGYGRFAADRDRADRTRDFHQLTSRFDAYLRRSGTGIAFFHRFHEGASVSSYDGQTKPRARAQRYLIELRQDVPFVPAMIGADMALLVGVRNVYYDDVDRRNLDEFAVKAPPRRLTGGIRVKF